VYNEEWIVPTCGTDTNKREDTIIGMNRHKRVRCALALLTMLTAGLLSGCASEAASDSALPTITVGSDTYPPYVYMDNNGDITGLDVDIAEEAFRRMGYRAEFTTIDWEQKTELVDNGEID
jgi:polar amino acid transport system substrate-binding protein